ncbi:MAG: hypothetical protein ACFFAL_00875 [Promethearchaeota archaeon]
MVRKITNAAFLLVGLCLLFSLMLNVPGCIANGAWDDDFDDSDYFGWTVLNGTYSALNQVLEANGTSINEWHNIYHESSVAYGFWSFDILANDTGGGLNFILVSFLADELAPPQANWLNPNNGYTLELNSRDRFIELIPWTGGSPDTQIGHWDAPALLGWQHVNITRNSDGLFNVYINGTLRIEGTDNTYTTSSFFGWCSKRQIALDNIIVNELVIIPPPPIPIELILIGAGAMVVIIVVIIVVVLLLRRRG